MQSQFTDKARAALLLAEKTAKRLRQGYVGTEHILVGLMQEKTGVAARVLFDNGVDENQVVEMIRDLISMDGPVAVKDRETYSPRAAKVLDIAHKQSERFGERQTGTEHILMALIKEGENVAVRLLNTLGISTQKIYIDGVSQRGEVRPCDWQGRGDTACCADTQQAYQEQPLSDRRARRGQDCRGRRACGADCIGKRTLYGQGKARTHTGFVRHGCREQIPRRV